MRIAIGQTLGRYRIEEEIGAGGMGVVYRAYDERLERDLAIKVLSPGTLDSEVARKRLRNEARVLSRLNHPSIQTVHDFDTADGTDFLVSELVPGRSLDARLASGPLPEKEVIRIGVQLAQGLAAAHAAGILHRDLKPANLRVTPDGNLKILDFGLATLSRDAVLQLSTTMSMADAPTGVAGTLPYMSPEQLLGNQIDERSDIYSAGVTLFELITRQLPFSDSLVPKLTNAILHLPPPLLSSYVVTISPELERIVQKCLEKDPELRYQSAKDLAADLRRMEAGSTRVATAVRSPTVKPRARGILFASVALLGVAIVGIAIWWVVRQHEEELSGKSLRWEQLTNFSDSAQIPAVSPDGKVVAFLRGTGDFGSSLNSGQVWFMTLPDGDPIQLTKTPFRKQTLSFSPDGTRVYFTQIQGPFAWNTFEVPILGAREPKAFMANATGLSWIGKDRLLFSMIKEGVHMGLVTSNTSRTDARDVYVPADQIHGMAHRSALSPDGRWVLLAEMDIAWWGRCRVVPFDGSSTGKQVGPEGTCTWVQWSPDGKWMYFTVDTGSSGFHVWRQRFPDGAPEQVTPSGASEEEGLAMMPDRKSFIIAAGTQQSSIWLHDDKTGDKQITSEGYAFAPTLSPDGRKVYYLRRAPGSHSYINGELWVSDVENGTAERVFPGLNLAHYSLSQDGKKVVFTTEQGQSRSGVWIAGLDRTQPPHQLTFGAEYRAFFGQPGEIIYLGTQKPARVMRMKEDGSEQRSVSDLEIMQLHSVSPGGRWAVVGVTPPGGHGDRNTMTLAVPLAGGPPVTVCDNCTSGFGMVRYTSPFITWTGDERTVFVPVRYFGLGSGKTLVIPTSPGSPPPAFVHGASTEQELERIPGAHLINDDNVYPTQTRAHYVIARRSAKTNLFRIYLSQ